MTQDKTRQALRHYKLALIHDSNLHTKLEREISQLYIQNRSWHQAIAMLDAVIAQQPQNHIALNGLGIAYRGLGSIKKPRNIWHKLWLLLLMLF